MKDIRYRNILTGKIIWASKWYNDWYHKIWEKEKNAGLYEESETKCAELPLEDLVFCGCEMLDNDEDWERID